MNERGTVCAVLSVFLVLNCTGQGTQLSVLRNHIEARFDIDLDSQYVVTTHTKSDVYTYLLENNFFSDVDDAKAIEEAKEILRTCAWRTESVVSVDSIFARDSLGKLHGAFIDFLGDSLSDYRFCYYKHGIIDSIEITHNCYGAEEIRRYRNGTKHGVSESIDSNGQRRWLTRYHMGEVVDTTYEYHQNGNVLAMRYYDNGKLVWEKCYEEDGTTEMECDF